MRSSVRTPEILRLDTALVFRPKDGVVANEDVRSMSASEDNDALEDCKAQDGVVQDFRPEITQAHRPPEEANRCS
jgi:hypothetical protein